MGSSGLTAYTGGGGAGGGDDEGILESLSSNKKSALAAFAAGPVTFILSLVIRELVLRPTAAVLGLIDWIASKGVDFYGWIDRTLVGTSQNTGILWDAGESFYAIPRAINGAVASQVSEFGLAAPLVLAISMLIQMALSAALVFGIVAVIISLIPGASGVTSTASELKDRLT